MPNVLRSPITLMTLLGIGFWFINSYEDRSDSAQPDLKSSIVLRIDSDQMMVNSPEVDLKRPTLSASRVTIDSSNFNALKEDAQPQGMLATFHAPCSEQPRAEPRGLTQATIVGLRVAPESAMTFTPRATQRSHANASDLEFPNSQPTPQTLHSSAPSQPARFHRIADGDDLSTLATKYLADPRRHLEIFEANKDKLTSPDLLPIGATLTIPPL